MLNGSLYSHLDGGSTFLSVECPSNAWPLNLLAIRVSLRPIFPLLTVNQDDESFHQGIEEIVLLNAWTVLCTMHFEGSEQTQLIQQGLSTEVDAPFYSDVIMNREVLSTPKRRTIWFLFKRM